MMSDLEQHENVIVPGEQKGKKKKPGKANLCIK